MTSHRKTFQDPAASNQPTPASIAYRIRALRIARGWSLADVERLSHRSLKAVVLGSYERGDRSISLARAIEIADIFSIPLSQLLCAPEKSAPVFPRTALMVDLRRARVLAENILTQPDPVLASISAFLAWIAARRGDWNGEIMSLRSADISTLSIMVFMNEESLLNWLNERRLIITELNRP